MSKLPIISIVKRFQFDSAHRLTGVPEDHPCSKLHGHTYNLEVEVKGVINPDLGWLIDYGDIKNIVKPLVDILDHSYLNEIEDLKYTTAEEIAVWLWIRIKPSIPDLYRVSVSETPSSGCNYFGEYND